MVGPISVEFWSWGPTGKPPTQKEMALASPRSKGDVLGTWRLICSVILHLEDAPQ